MGKLIVYKGDDTTGIFGRHLQITITADPGIALTGCKAEFSVLGITKSWSNITIGQQVEIIFSHAETSLMPLGTAYASFRIVDANGNIRTFNDSIPFTVTNDLRQVYPGSSSIAIAIGQMIKWTDIQGRPDLEGLQQTVAGHTSSIATINTSIGSLSSSVYGIDAKIPTQASSSNQLADKNFVNSSIGTNTANYISNNGQPFNSLAELHAYSGVITNNDYAFVIGTDTAGNTTYSRYKYSTASSPASWSLEYVLNNSSFTAQQWAAISSGITGVDQSSATADISATSQGVAARANSCVRWDGSKLRSPDGNEIQTGSNTIAWGNVTSKPSYPPVHIILNTIDLSNVSWSPSGVIILAAQRWEGVYPKLLTANSFGSAIWFRVHYGNSILTSPLEVQLDKWGVYRIQNCQYYLNIELLFEDNTL